MRKFIRNDSVESKKQSEPSLAHFEISKFDLSIFLDSKENNRYFILCHRYFYLSNKGFMFILIAISTISLCQI